MGAAVVGVAFFDEIAVDEGEEPAVVAAFVSTVEFWLEESRDGMIVVVEGVVLL